MVIIILAFLPVFALSGQEGKLFHPLAFTAVCEEEALDLQENLESFHSANTEVVFVSCDSSAARQAWRRQLGAETEQWARFAEAIEQALAQLRAQGMPLGIDNRFEGAAQAFGESLSSTLWLVLAAVVTMYIVLGMLYESYIHPVTILSTLPSAAVGALLALLLSGHELGMMAVIGIILLIGIVKKNAIMMIDFELDAERHQGLSPREAIEQACLLRFRPILMTTMCALLGALPLMLGNGVGSELRQPLGVTLVGGLIVSQLLTLFTTPVIYLYLDRFRRRDRDTHSRLARAMGGFGARA